MKNIARKYPAYIVSRKSPLQTTKLKMMRRHRASRPRQLWPGQQVTCLMPQHWALRQAFQDLELDMEAVVTYVVHPVRGAPFLRYIVVIVHFSHSSAKLLLHQAYGPLQLVVPLSLPGMGGIFLRRLLRDNTPQGIPLLTFSDLPIMISAGNGDFVFPNAHCLHVFSRRLVYALPVSHLEASLRDAFSVRQSTVEPQVRVLGLVYERAALSGEERVVPVAVQATLDMVTLYHPDLSWVNVRASNGHALLVHAAPQPDLVRLMLGLGADPELRSRNGSSFLREVLGRLPGWQPPATIQTLVGMAMSHVGTLRSWEDDPTQVLSRLHDKVLGSPPIMHMLLDARFFTPSLPPTIPGRLPAHVRSFLESLLQRSLPLSTVCRQRLWDVLRQCEQRRRQEVLREMVAIPGLQKLLLYLDMADTEADPLALMVVR